MGTYEQLRNRTRHDPILAGDNSSYMVAAHFPTDELERLLPGAMSLPSADDMAERYPTVAPVEGMHPFVMMCSNCRNVHDVMTDIELRHYRELMFFIPVTHTHGGEQQHCSYVPVLYLDFLMGVVGGLYLGLRKEFHRRMKDVETATTKTFAIDGLLHARFDTTGATAGTELDPFFAATIQNPTVTVSYFRRTRFYTTRAAPTRVADASSEFEWRYKESVITDNDHSFAQHVDLHFTTSQAMGYDAYFHPKRRQTAPTTAEATS